MPSQIIAKPGGVVCSSIFYARITHRECILGCMYHILFPMNVQKLQNPFIIHNEYKNNNSFNFKPIFQPKSYQQVLEAEYPTLI